MNTTTSAELLNPAKNQTPNGPEMIGAEILVHALHAEGVEYV